MTTPKAQDVRHDLSKEVLGGPITFKSYEGAKYFFQTLERKYINRFILKKLIEETRLEFPPSHPMHEGINYALNRLESRINKLQ